MYAHGGGAVGGDAKDFGMVANPTAVTAGVTFFNVDYRLGPETKAPGGIADFYAALKYVVENAEELGVDKSRICIKGESGGGYICAGTGIMLAEKNESHLVKF